MYKYELHCHTGDVSLCAKISPEDLLRRYRDAGYSGLVITNHFSPMTFWRAGMLQTKKQVETYLSAYRRMLECAGDDFTVLLGLELRHYATDGIWRGVEKNLHVATELRAADEQRRTGSHFERTNPNRVRLSSG